MEKIGLVTNNSEVIVQIFWKNPKHTISITSMFLGNNKTFFTDKTKNSDNIILTELPREDEGICKIFDTYFLPMLPKASSFDK